MLLTPPSIVSMCEMPQDRVRRMREAIDDFFVSLHGHRLIYELISMEPAFSTRTRRLAHKMANTRRYEGQRKWSRAQRRLRRQCDAENAPVKRKLAQLALNMFENYECRRAQESITTESTSP